MSRVIWFRSVLSLTVSPSIRRNDYEDIANSHTCGHGSGSFPRRFRSDVLWCQRLYDMGPVRKPTHDYQLLYFYDERHSVSRTGCSARSLRNEPRTGHRFRESPRPCVGLYMYEWRLGEAEEQSRRRTAVCHSK